MRISDWSSDVCSSDLSYDLADDADRADRAQLRADPRDAKPALADRLSGRRPRGRADGVGHDHLADQGAGAQARAQGTGIGLSLAAGLGGAGRDPGRRSEEHTSELQSLMRLSYAVFCLKKKNSK